MPTGADDDDFDVIDLPLPAASFSSHVEPGLAAGSIEFSYRPVHESVGDKVSLRVVLKAGDGKERTIGLSLAAPDTPLTHRHALSAPAITLEEFERNKANSTMLAMKARFVRFIAPTKPLPSPSLMFTGNAEERVNSIVNEKANSYRARLKSQAKTGGSYEAVLGLAIRDFDAEYKAAYVENFSNISDDIATLYNFGPMYRQTEPAFFLSHVRNLIAGVRTHHEAMQKAAASMIATLDRIHNTARDIADLKVHATLARTTAYESLDDAYLRRVTIASARPPSCYLPRIERQFPAGQTVASVACQIAGFDGRSTGDRSDIVGITREVDDLGLLLDLDIELGLTKALMERAEGRSRPLADLLRMPADRRRQKRDALMAGLRQEAQAAAG